MKFSKSVLFIIKALPPLWHSKKIMTETWSDRAFHWWDMILVSSNSMYRPIFLLLYYRVIGGKVLAKCVWQIVCSNITHLYCYKCVNCKSELSVTYSTNSDMFLRVFYCLHEKKLKLLHKSVSTQSSKCFKLSICSGAKLYPQWVVKTICKHKYLV